MTESDIHAFIARHKYAVLSTFGQSVPESALVGIAITPNLEIIFDTAASSRKYGNLKTNPACSFVVGGWDSERTVQYEGRAKQLNGEARDYYVAIYLKVFRDGAVRAASPDIVHFIVRPTWIRFSDYYTAPPTIQEFRW